MSKRLIGGFFDGDEVTGWDNRDDTLWVTRYTVDGKRWDPDGLSVYSPRWPENAVSHLYRNIKGELRFQKTRPVSKGNK